MNVHDSEKVAGVLAARGYRAVETPEEADLVLYNTCSIRDKAEQKVYSRLQQFKRASGGKTFAVLGCVAQQEGERIFERAPHVSLVCGSASYNRLPALLDQVEAVEIEVYPRARGVVNERTGTVVIGGTVRLQPVSILHGGLSVNVISETKVSQPNALSSGTTQVVQQTTIQAQDKPVNRIDLKEGATVEDLVQELQRTGAGARDVISILQAMKEAGALEADLEVL